MPGTPLAVGPGREQLGALDAYIADMRPIEVPDAEASVGPVDDHQTIIADGERQRILEFIGALPFAAAPPADY
jgi:hypothetical protein